MLKDKAVDFQLVRNVRRKLLHNFHMSIGIRIGPEGPPVPRIIPQAIVIGNLNQQDHFFNPYNPLFNRKSQQNVSALHMFRVGNLLPECCLGLPTNHNRCCRLTGRLSDSATGSISARNPTGRNAWQIFHEKFPIEAPVFQGVVNSSMTLQRDGHFDRWLLLNGQWTDGGGDLVAQFKRKNIYNFFITYLSETFTSNKRAHVRQQGFCFAEWEVMPNCDKRCCERKRFRRVHGKSKLPNLWLDFTQNWVYRKNKLPSYPAYSALYVLCI